MHGRSDAILYVIPAFLADGGAMGTLMRGHDWGASPLGDPATWPCSLATLVGTMLASHQPMFLVWGSGRTLLYNDLYADMLGDRHPAALGRDYLEVWSDIRADLEPLVEAAASGRPVHADRPVHRLDRGQGTRRHGSPCSTRRSAMRPGASRVSPAPARRFRAPPPSSRADQRQVHDNEERQSFLLDLSDALRPLTAPTDIAEVAARRLGERVGASRVFYAEIGGSLMTVERDYTKGVVSLVGKHSLADFGPDLLAAYRDNAVVAVGDIAADPRFSVEARAGLTSRQVAAYVDVILFREELWVGLWAVQSATPRAWTQAEENLIREVGERVKAAIERGRARDGVEGERGAPGGDLHRCRRRPVRGGPPTAASCG